MHLLYILLLSLPLQYVEGSILSKFREMFGLMKRKHPDKKLDNPNQQKIVEKKLSNTPRTVTLGTSDFAQVIENNLMYVDKTTTISEIMKDGATVILITRPNRWGKSLGLSMIEHFFANNDSLRREHSIDLFKGLHVSKQETFCKLHKNKYPVMFISFQYVSNDTYSAARESLVKAIANAFKQHAYLLERGKLTPFEKAEFLQLLSGTSDDRLLKSSLEKLSHFLYSFTGQRVFLILDEYDKPYLTAYSHKFYGKMHDLFTGILSRALKDNHYLRKAIMAGISPTPRACIYSGLNNVEVYSVLDDCRYSRLFGFTDEELESLLNEASLSRAEETFKHWYSGCVFSGNIIYNPFSTMKFISRGGKPGVYWPATAPERLLEYVLSNTGKNVRAIFFHLFQGGQTEAMKIFDDLDYGDLRKRENIFFTLMVHSGYLNAVPATEHNYGGEYFLRIPNVEVNRTLCKIFNNVFGAGIFDEVMKFGEHIRGGNVEGIEKLVASSLMESGSYYSFHKVQKSDPEGQRREQESVYHSYLLGLFTSQKGLFILKTEQESGKGRFDLGLLPNTTACPRCPGYIFKFEVTPDEESIDVTAGVSLKQIKDRHYEIGFQWPGCEKLIGVGVAFCGKRVSIRYEELKKKNK